MALHPLARARGSENVSGFRVSYRAAAARKRFKRTVFSQTLTLMRGDDSLPVAPRVSKGTKLRESPDFEKYVAKIFCQTRQESNCVGTTPNGMGDSEADQPGADREGRSHRDSPQRVVLHIDSTKIPVYGHQENSAYNGHFESTCNREADCLGAKLRPGNVLVAWRAI